MAGLEQVEKIWMDGTLVPWGEANVHVLTHALHYGSGVFEGIRCYNTPEGPAIFRGTDHMQRLDRSARMLRMEQPYSVEALVEATKDVIRANGIKECYIRPLLFKGYGQMGLNPLGSKEQMIIAVWPWGSYLGEEALTSGVDVVISSWRQRSPNATPPAIKATGNYLNSSLAKIEAVDRGCDEAILLNEDGHVCEGTGENIFVVKGGKLVTPPVSDGILEGITRDSVMTLAKEMGYEVIESSIIRTDLYTAEEMFMCGTAAEIVPVRSIDGREIGSRGPVTEAIQAKYFKVVSGEEPDYEAWLERV